MHNYSTDESGTQVWFKRTVRLPAAGAMAGNTTVPSHSESGRRRTDGSGDGSGQSARPIRAQENRGAATQQWMEGVSRPVCSPNLDFQMIGRGLRGPLNGGDERCLILNVRDNIENFDRRLAFSELDWLWA